MHTFQGVYDHVHAGDANLEEIGRRVILPATFIGSPRDQFQLYQDSMAIVRKYGKPDLFVTYTCNPNWAEINRELLPGQTASNRPDIVNRVFDLRRREFLDEMTKEGIFGRVVAFVAVIEFQKRGFPHMHSILWLHTEDKFRTAEDVDTVVSAEIPDPVREPQLYETVTRTMMHRCSHRCQPDPQSGTCKYGYPKPFVEETAVLEGACPRYQRKDNGRVFTATDGRTYTNRDVVPYNPYVTKVQATHVNAECCFSIGSVKYLLKYVYKGHDRASFAIDIGGHFDSAAPQAPAVNEIDDFVNGRWVSQI